MGGYNIIFLCWRYDDITHHCISFFSGPRGNMDDFRTNARDGLTVYTRYLLLFIFSFFSLFIVLLLSFFLSFLRGQLDFVVRFTIQVYYYHYDYYYFIHKPKKDATKQPRGKKYHYIHGSESASSLWSVVYEPWSITDSPKRASLVTQREHGIWSKLHHDDSSRPPWTV